MKIRAICTWADCWKSGDLFEVHTDETGLAYIFCNDHDAGPYHYVDNGGEMDLTPLDIQQGKSKQFVCEEE